MQASGLAPVAYGYDVASRLTGVAQGQQPVTLAYDLVNRRTSLVLPNGVTVSYMYDEASRLIGQTYTGPGGSLGDLSYTYDATGNRIATGGTWARSLLPDTVLSSNYDQSNKQLAFGQVAQTFDANGNLIAQADANGTTTYTWDARNRLVAVNGPNVNASFSYDALGRRVSRTVDSVSVTFHYDGLDMVRESGPAGETSYLRTLTIDETLSRTDASGSVTYLADVLGSTVALADANGTPATDYTYEPFGRTSVSGLPSPNPFQFTGRENDGTGLYYYRARHYSPSLHRFISQDPMGLVAGTNLYRYVLNNPFLFIDRLGLDVTVTLHRGQGANPFGHMGIAIGSGETVGLTAYPASPREWIDVLNGRSIPGQVEAVHSNVPEESITIQTTPQQDEAMRRMIDAASSTQRTYNLYNRNCPHFVEEVLGAGGVQSPSTRFPRKLMRQLQETYGTPVGRPLGEFPDLGPFAP